MGLAIRPCIIATDMYRSLSDLIISPPTYPSRELGRR